MRNFDFHNIKIEKDKFSNAIIVTGEVTNLGGKNYATIAGRIVLFVKNTPISNTIFTVNGLQSGTTKSFEKVVDELDYGQVGKDITHHEIYVESGF
ncbi:MAG: FxLYD domain-containing protein [Candidatus Omnitrophica bacterium]|nr:FxLYD domain-containing protein [Candidatus Omnitrophota bacterium]